MFAGVEFYPGLAKALKDLGINTPTPVQQATLPVVLAGQNAMVSAQTGSGKTLAYLLPVLHMLATRDAPSQGSVRALVLVPTRELARQVYKLSEQLVKSMPINSAMVTGGEKLKVQAAALRKAPEVVVATPGRLVELFDHNAVDLSCLELLVLDEADRMLDMGFHDDMERVHGQVMTGKTQSPQTVMLSATLAHRGVKQIAAQWMENPVVLHLDKQAPHQDIVQQVMLADDRGHKEKLLAWVLKHVSFSRALVFVNTRDHADRLGGLIRYFKHHAGVLHGEKEHSIRKQVMEQFAHGKMRVLVASDVAARGLDIPDVDLVINFDFPRTGDDYTHRTGRTGRAGNQGLAISFVSPQEWNRMISIQRYLGIAFERREAENLVGHFTGPKKMKSSGKAAGSKKKKLKKTPAATGKKATKRKTAVSAKSGSAPKSKQPARASKGVVATPERTGFEPVMKKPLRKPSSHAVSQPKQRQPKNRQD